MPAPPTRRPGARLAREGPVVQVNGVTGPIESSRFGWTLMHEHLFMLDPGLRDVWPATFDRADGMRRAVAALREARAAGIETIVDLTTYDLGRDAFLLQEAVREADVQVIAATGLWLQPPRALQASSADFLAGLFTRDIEEGIQGTSVKAAIIKLATNDARIGGPFDAIFRGAARAHRRTGVPISTHTDVWNQSGLDQQRVLAEEGVDLTRVVIGHSGDSEDLDYLQRLLDRGSYLGMDRFGLTVVGGRSLPSTEQRARVIAELCRRGYADRLVLSHDICIVGDPDLPEGLFTFIPRTVVPALLEAGVSRAQVDQMLRD